MFSSYFVRVSRITVRYIPKNEAFGWLQALCMYGSLGMSMPSLHRESIDSLIATCKKIDKINVVSESPLLFFTNIMV